ncbi:MAG: hypothetical protein Q9183_005589, partial [Haloplaca sp. 2 TL-2023]
MFTVENDSDSDHEQYKDMMKRAIMLAGFYPIFSGSVDGTRDSLVALINRVLKRMWDLRLSNRDLYDANNKDTLQLEGAEREAW